MHKDARGKPLEIGDSVVYSGGMYKQLKVGIVIGFTPKLIRVGPNLTSGGTLKASDQVAKVE